MSNSGDRISHGYPGHDYPIPMGATAWCGHVLTRDVAKARHDDTGPEWPLCRQCVSMALGQGADGLDREGLAP